MSISVPPLSTFLAEIPEFRKARSKRYTLLALLLYVCVAMLCGRRSQAAIADWGKDYGQPWLAHLGLRRERSPSQPTIHRLFKGIRREQVEHALCSPKTSSPFVQKAWDALCRAPVIVM
jgi:hypothetical protein